MNARWICALLLAVAPMLQAAPPATAETDALLGFWAGDGEFMAKPTKMELRFVAVLGGAFRRLEVDIRAPNASASTFSGHAYYQAGENGAWTAQWFDSNGAQYAETAQFADGCLKVQWNFAPGRSGRSSYCIIDAQKLQVTDEAQGKSGEWKVFASHRLSRGGPSQR